MASQGYKRVLERPGFAYLLAAQALAVFDDNTFKQLLIFFIIGQGFETSRRNWLIALGTCLYVLPYILFSSYAGQVADRFSKRQVTTLIRRRSKNRFWPRCDNWIESDDSPGLAGRQRLFEWSKRGVLEPGLLFHPSQECDRPPQFHGFGIRDFSPVPDLLHHLSQLPGLVPIR